MSEAKDSNTSLIYIPLLDEGTEVVRPTLGIQLGGNVYRVLATANYDAVDECWKFPPDSIVRCVAEVKDGEEVLVAKELAVEN